MISRLLLPGFASGAPCDVLPRAQISSHSSQADHVQRTVGLPIATSVEAVAHYLSGGGFHGRHSAERLAKEASLLNLWGLSPAAISSVAALSVPMPGKETNSRAACATRRSSSPSSSAIS
jgi:hypothetical protein